MGDTVNRDSFGDALVLKRAGAFRRLLIRITDIIIAGLCLASLAPLLIIVVVLVKISSPGPILVGQWRFGYRNRPVLVHRFRTTFAVGENAGNLTFVGAVMRQTGIDDLPMLEDVLSGQMSIFGPPPSAYPNTALNYRKPGIARWAEMLNSQRTSE